MKTNWQRWSDEDVALLKTCAAAGMSQAATGRELCRTDQSVQQAAMRYGVKFDQRAPDTWMPEVVAQMRALHAEGIAQAAIAKRLGLTRNQVISKMKRLGLKVAAPSKPVKVKRIIADLPHGGGTVRSDPKSDAQRAAWIGRKNTKVIALPVSTAQPFKGEPVSLLDLAPDHCKFQVAELGGAFLFCNDEAPGAAPYCPRHCKIAYDKPATSRSELVRSLRRFA